MTLTSSKLYLCDKSTPLKLGDPGYTSRKKTVWTQFFATTSDAESLEASGDCTMYFLRVALAWLDAKSVLGVSGRKLPEHIKKLNISTATVAVSRASCNPTNSTNTSRFTKDPEQSLFSKVRERPGAVIPVPALPMERGGGLSSNASHIRVKCVHHDCSALSIEQLWCVGVHGL